MIPKMKKKKNRLQRIFALKLANQSSTSSLSLCAKYPRVSAKVSGLSTPGGGTPLSTMANFRKS